MSQQSSNARSCSPAAGFFVPTQLCDEKLYHWAIASIAEPLSARTIVPLPGSYERAYRLSASDLSQETVPVELGLIQDQVYVHDVIVADLRPFIVDYEVETGAYLRRHPPAQAPNLASSSHATFMFAPDPVEFFPSMFHSDIVWSISYDILKFPWSFPTHRRSDKKRYTAGVAQW
jgi:hypothetical protein